MNASANVVSIDDLAISTSTEDTVESTPISHTGDGKIRFIHKINPSGRGGATIAYALTDGVYTIGVAKCNVKDNYCRRLGRDVATSRFLETPIYIRSLLDEDDEQWTKKEVPFITEYLVRARVL